MPRAFRKVCGIQILNNRPNCMFMPFANQFTAIHGSHCLVTFVNFLRISMRTTERNESAIQRCELGGNNQKQAIAYFVCGFIIKLLYGLRVWMT